MMGWADGFGQTAQAAEPPFKFGACTPADLLPGVVTARDYMPAFAKTKPACEKLIGQCKCQFNIEMKWTRVGCTVRAGDGVNLLCNSAVALLKLI